MKKNNNKVLGWLPYLIVLVAMMSLFGMNNLTGNKTVTYQTLTKIVETNFRCIINNWNKYDKCSWCI